MTQFTDIGDPYNRHSWSPRSRHHQDMHHAHHQPPIQSLTPPQSGGSDRDNLASDQGNDGMTALMCAVISGANMSDTESDDSSSIIDELMRQDVSKVNNTNHRTGETALHLAARYNNPGAAKKLLEAGAQPNAEDGTGRTPLHTAVAADAVDVFRVSFFLLDFYENVPQETRNCGYLMGKRNLILYTLYRFHCGSFT